MHFILSVDAICHLCLYGVMLEMMYFHAHSSVFRKPVCDILIVFRWPLVLMLSDAGILIVRQNDSELEVQRYGIKKNTLTVDPIMLADELWMRQREKPSPNRQNSFFENQTAETDFSGLEFWGQFGSTFRKTNMRHFRLVPHTPGVDAGILLLRWIPAYVTWW